VSAADGNKKAAARALGISNAALYRLFGMHGVRDRLVKPCVRADVPSVDLMNSLRAANGNKKAAARELGISRPALYRLLGKYGSTGEPAGPLASR
jgi:transcriptional regulator of acetoin/glycerol metabolism